MKLMDWFKQKFVSHEQTVAVQQDTKPLISITIVPSLPKTAAPVVESEIIFNNVHEKINVLQNDCFPELAIVHGEYRAWCEKVQQIMREKKSCDYNPAAVGSLLMSTIEQWLHNEGKALIQFTEYGELMSAHARFQRCAGSILVKHQRGEFLDAVGMLRSDFKAHANEVEQALANLLTRARRDYCGTDCTNCHSDKPTAH
ncbi:hypothetical protein [Alysiella filiformis]|uniref:Chemoreceptor zinc-binding domain-containing protein n=1 Tax=Alysiella filiformis DSM 16848 TaxID=1120981 RepID=A0A286ECY7_9NEIS|nr:hypothetical protein [Alysiella filiformis]QMT31929.1 hypothetical protein H3L97_03360 [Alysiella filiformis]UBQ57164.1 hypothetical protein JF568_05315 [Alysiella filiformis DSM 16848]SOD68782.1 hypothetical protein SAMN02746062_01402 [Alysiella filiformis DSM 16848]